MIPSKSREIKIIECKAITITEQQECSCYKRDGIYPNCFYQDLYSSDEITICTYTEKKKDGK